MFRGTAIGRAGRAEGATVRFIVEPSIWSLFPDVRIGVVIVRGIDNRRKCDRCDSLLAERSREAAALIGDVELAAHSRVAPWREAYRRFGAKPSRYRSSLESLLRAARAGGPRSINPLVDLYNAVSLAALLPCGGEDLSAVRGDVRLTRAAGDELFVPLGSDAALAPSAGEVIYRDDQGVLCRCWNWREAERTKLTEATTDAFLCLEALPPVTAVALESACRLLAGLVVDHLGGSAEIALIDRSRPALDIPR